MAPDETVTYFFSQSLPFLSNKPGASSQQGSQRIKSDLVHRTPPLNVTQEVRLLFACYAKIRKPNWWLVQNVFKKLQPNKSRTLPNNKNNNNNNK